MSPDSQNPSLVTKKQEKELNLLCLVSDNHHYFKLIQSKHQTG